MYRLIFFIFFLIFFFGFSSNLSSQVCPESNLRKNSTCISFTYPTSGAASLALAGMEQITVSGTTSSDGIYTASIICNSTRVVFTRNGSSSCNCNGYNGTTSGTVVFEDLGLTCTYNADGTLPVTFSYFLAKSENYRNYLEWGTSNEINNLGFEIQRSRDGRRFHTLGFVDGEGTTEEIQDYRFVDLEVDNVTNYYRLKQIDFNGAFDYSRVVSIKNLEEDKAPSIRIVQGEISVSYEDGLSEVHIYDLQGSLLKKVVQNASDVTFNSQSFPDQILILKSVAQSGKVFNNKVFNSSF